MGKTQGQFSEYKAQVQVLVGKAHGAKLRFAKFKVPRALGNLEQAMSWLKLA